MKYVSILFLLTGCGMQVSVDPVKSDPVRVIHSVDINFDSVFAYCENKCTASSTDPSQIRPCADECYATFLETLAQAVGGFSNPR